MNEPDSTQLLPVLVWHDPRVHLLDDTWLLTIFAILLGIALPWFVSGLHIDFAATAAGLLALAAVHVVLAAISGVRPSSQSRGTLGLSSLHALGVAAMVFIWHHAGGLQNPLFLAVFALPVIGSIFLSRWQPYLMATLASLLVLLAASSEAPELRWYAPWLGTAGDWLETLLGSARAGASLPFAAFYAPSQYFVVLLEVFVVVMFACAVAAEYLERLRQTRRADVDGACRSGAQSGTMGDARGAAAGGGGSARRRHARGGGRERDRVEELPQRRRAGRRPRFLRGDPVVLPRAHRAARRRRGRRGAGLQGTLRRAAAGDRDPRAASRAARAPIRAGSDQRYDGGLLREGRARRRRVRHPRGRRSGARGGSQQAGARALWRGQSRRRGVEPGAAGQPGHTLVGSGLERPPQDARDRHAAHVPGHDHRSGYAR